MVSSGVQNSTILKRYWGTRINVQFLYSEAKPLPKPYNTDRQLQDKKPNSVTNTITPQPSVTEIRNWIHWVACQWQYTRRWHRHDTEPGVWRQRRGQTDQAGQGWVDPWTVLRVCPTCIKSTKPKEDWNKNIQCGIFLKTNTVEDLRRQRACSRTCIMDSNCYIKELFMKVTYYSFSPSINYVLLKYWFYVQINVYSMQKKLWWLM